MRTLPWTWWDSGAAGLIAGVTVVLVWNLWQPGIPNPGDMLMSIYRLFELDQSWRNGVFFPRFGPNLNFGYSAPLFQFYPPLVSYGMFVFHKLGLGFLDAAKAMLTLNLLLAGLGTYGYARWLAGNRLVGVASALLYLLAPYMMTVTYERGAASESLALALLPWLFWSMHRQLYDRSFVKVCLSAVLVAAMMLAHNITALFAVPAVIVYVGLLALAEHRSRSLLQVALAVALGFGLSAFYWAPALAEVRFTKIEAHMLSGNTDVRTWLVEPVKLLQSSLLFMYAGPERFRFAVWTFLIGLPGVGESAFLSTPAAFRCRSVRALFLPDHRHAVRLCPVAMGAGAPDPVHPVSLAPVRHGVVLRRHGCRVDLRLAARRRAADGSSLLAWWHCWS